MDDGTLLGILITALFVVVFLIIQDFFSIVDKGDDNEF